MYFLSFVFSLSFLRTWNGSNIWQYYILYCLHLTKSKALTGRCKQKWAKQKIQWSMQNFTSSAVLKQGFVDPPQGKSCIFLVFLFLISWNWKSCSYSFWTKLLVVKHVSIIFTLQFEKEVVYIVYIVILWKQFTFLSFSRSNAYFLSPVKKNMMLKVLVRKTQASVKWKGCY